jgi:hypothetical protein
VLKHLLVRAHLLVVPALALWMSVSIVQAAEECRLKPGATAPSGSKWVYRVNRADHRHCWFLSSQAAGSYSHVVHRYRHLAGDPEAAREDQQGDTDLQIASAPTNKSDVALAARLLAVSQAAAPSEKSSDDLVPHSVPIILYRLPPANAQTVTEPTIRTRADHDADSHDQIERGSSCRSSGSRSFFCWWSFPCYTSRPQAIT